MLKKLSGLNWVRLIAMIGQMWLAALVTISGIRVQLGIQQPPPGYGSEAWNPFVILIAVAAMVAAVGIVWQRFWGYFLQLGVIWSIILLAIVTQDPRLTSAMTHPPRWPLLDAIHLEWIEPFFWFAIFVFLNVHLIQRGFELYHARGETGRASLST